MTNPKSEALNSKQYQNLFQVKRGIYNWRLPRLRLAMTHCIILEFVYDFGFRNYDLFCLVSVSF